MIRHETHQLGLQWGKFVDRMYIVIYYIEHDMLVSVHSDDFAGAGSENDLRWFDAVLAQRLVSKLTGLIGPQGERSGKLLKRTIGWSSAEFTWDS
eukprot:5632153-Amphidinium_carterae.1